MSRSLSELSELVARVSDIYAERNDIARDGDWYILKLQEELGELTAEHLKATGRGRLKGATQKIVQQAKEDEAADVLAMLLLFARQNSIDLDAARTNRHSADAGLQMEVFCASGAHVRKVRCAPVLENHHFRLSLS